jgi:hypothetical protein
LVVHAWRGDGDWPGGCGDRARPGSSVTDHQTVTLVVNLSCVRGDVGVDLGLQRYRQHAAGTFSDQVIQTREPVRARCAICLYTQHRRAFLAGVSLPVPLRLFMKEGTPRSLASH